MAWNLQIEAPFCICGARFFFAYEAVCDVLSGNDHFMLMWFRPEMAMEMFYLFWAIDDLLQFPTCPIT